MREVLGGTSRRRRVVAGVLVVVAGLVVASCRPAPARWKPRAGLAWQWQLTGTIDQSVDVPVYDLDLFDTSSQVVASLHRKGRKVICYVSVGSYENWRPDAHRFPASVLGSNNGWPGERWLDIRRLDVLGPILRARFDMCKAKGFDAVEPDNVDAYANKSGFPLTASDQLAFNRFVARIAHERGLAVGLKNDLDQVPQLVNNFDFAVNEQCAQYDECDALAPFVRANKPVFHAEYELTPVQFCAVSRRVGLSSIQKRDDLDAWRRSC